MKHTPIREQVRTLVESKGITQAELSRLSGVPRTAINAYLNTDRDITTETADRLLSVLLSKKS